MMQIPFGNLPGGTDLFLDYTSNWAKVRRFYSHPYTLESILSFGRRRLEEGLPHRELLCRALAMQQHAWGGDTRSVDKLASGAVAVVAGQQPGLFTGPMYTIFKAITAIKVAQVISERGLPAVPVFWIAAEDHDYEEIQWATVLDRNSELRRLQVDLQNEQAVPDGWLELKDDVRATVSNCLSSLPQSEFQPELAGILDWSYRPGLSPVDAFARMMVRLFGKSGLILADPLHPDLKTVAAPILKQIASRNEEIRRVVLARSREISEAGYHEQVKVDSGFTGLFAFHGRSRFPLKPDMVNGTDRLSPNVLTRPFVQDSIFPTVAFIAGPSEIAYLAQAAAVYESFGKELTPIYPRIAATLIEPRVAKSLRKYGIAFTDVLQGKEFIKRKAVESLQGEGLFASVKAGIGANLESLRPTLLGVDPTLAGALDTAKQKVMYQVEALETKLVNAETRRSDLIEKHLDLISHSIFPEKKLQERYLNVTSFVARYGIGLLKRIEDELALDPTQHQLFEI